MIKSILFIYLELFTLRYSHDYCKRHLISVRELFFKIISENDYDSISSFLSDFRFQATYLSLDEFVIVMDFFKFLSKVDKITNM